MDDLDHYDNPVDDDYADDHYDDRAPCAFLPDAVRSNGAPLRERAPVEQSCSLGVETGGTAPADSVPPSGDARPAAPTETISLQPQQSLKGGPSTVLHHDGDSVAPLSATEHTDGRLAGRGRRIPGSYTLRFTLRGKPPRTGRRARQ